MKWAVLIALLSVVLILVGIFVGIKIASVYFSKRIANVERTKNNYWSSFLMVDKWLDIKQKGKSISNWLVNKGYKKIAIYGMGEAGKRLYEELVNSEVEVVYGIDASAGDINSKLAVHYPDKSDMYDKVDAVVVTVPFYFESIYKNLSKNGYENICSLLEILDLI